MRKFFKRVTKAVSGDSHRRSLDPTELTEAVLDAAYDDGKAWDDLLELPNSYEIQIPRREWESYYGNRISQTEERLSRALVQFASEIGATMEDPEVSIMVDATMHEGSVAVNAAFTQPNNLAATAVYMHDDCRGYGEDELGWMATPSFVEEQVPDETDPAVPEVVPCTPCVEREVAYANVPDGPSFEVFEGSTIGIVRDPSRERPTICLPYSDALHFAAQIQGEFLHDEEGWFFANRGRNGTSVLRGSSFERIEEHPFLLRDNDVLCFGTPDVPALVFHAKVA